MASLAPVQIAEWLSKRVVGQAEAVREMSVALAKKLAGLGAGNILMIGSSGSGKTTLMQAVEAMLASSPALATRSTVVRIHANVLGEEVEQGQPGARLLLRLLSRARQQLGAEAKVERLLEQASHGLVFVDEVDKIRSHVGGAVNVAGIRAQEALLTLIENEAVPFTLPDWAGGKTISLNSSGLLFVCAGAFEGLYDAVFHRVTAGRDKGALQTTTVVEAGRVREELQFKLRDWLKHEDLFEYGVTPQFLSRFDGVVLLEPLSVDDLLRIFVTGSDAGFRQSAAYFKSQGIKLEVTEQAARRVAEEAAQQPRLGARALKEAFRRVIGRYEFDPKAAHVVDGVLRIDRPQVEHALAAGKPKDRPATSATGWEETVGVPWSAIEGRET